MTTTALLVTSPARDKNNFWTCSITSPVGSRMPPCDLASIAAVLREGGVEPRIFDMRLYENPLAALDREVRETRPDALITNMGTASAMEDYEIFRVVREVVERRIAFCFHAMALPEEMFERGATHVLVGDPEYAAVAAATGGKCDKGLWTPGNTDAEPGWISELDAMPLPALDLIDLDAYHSLIMGRDRFSILLANRGCPYGCTYCVIPILFGRKVRRFSVKRVVDEIERDYCEFNIRKFFFIDSAINLKPEWTIDLCEEVLRRGLDIKWCANMRVSPVEPDLLNLMKRSGCFRVFFGVEDLDMIDKLERKTTVEATERAFRLTREAGIETVAFTILLPGIDASEGAMAKRMVDMVARLDADALQCNIAIPYPGTKMYAEYTEKCDMPRDWRLYDPAGAGAPYPVELDLVKARRLVYWRYFMRNPRYVWTTLLRTDLRSILTFAKNSFQVFFARPPAGQQTDLSE